MITGSTAAELAESVREQVERGALSPGDPLPPVRELAAATGVNRNTVVSAYRQLARAGLAVTAGRRGTRIAGPGAQTEEGFAATTLRDIADGNPDPAWLPDLDRHLAGVASARPALYGTPALDPDLAAWATEWLAEDCPRELVLTMTHGAVDAVERLLAQALTRGDAVGLEDPCFLSSIHTARVAGYRTVPIAVDAEGMTPDGLRSALEQGVRAIVCTPRAHNPTGVSLTTRRAAALREILTAHPYVLVIEDDHYSLLSTTSYATVIPPEHRRWALVRSMSKFLGPDLRVAVVGSDPTTGARLGQRLSPGTSWVSHLLQRLACSALSDESTQRDIERAARHYAQRNRAFVDRLADLGVEATADDGLNVWVDVGDTAEGLDRLRRAGWLGRAGAEFTLGSTDDRHLRLTVHRLDDAAAAGLARVVSGD